MKKPSTTRSRLENPVRIRSKPFKSTLSTSASLTTWFTGSTWAFATAWRTASGPYFCKMALASFSPR